MNQSSDPRPHDETLESAFCEYLARVDSGEKVDTREFVAQYPAIADSLARHIATDSFVQKMAGPTFAETGDFAGGTIVLDKVKPGPIEQTVNVVAAQGTIDTRCDIPAKDWSIPTEFGRYRVEKMLGQGAMGAVYLAHDTQLDRRVALKVPKFDQAQDSDTLERFYREARAVATLHHPNICPVYDVGEINGRTFLSMAFIEGRPLSDFVTANKKQGQRSVARLVMKLALALQEAHDIGVVHRDLKPANIMVSKKGEPVVMDFGLARRIDSTDTRVTQSGAIVGTPAYMSPEQVEGEPERIGPLSDQYSLGVILYELLSGRLPFQGSILSVIGQIAHKDPMSVAALRPDLDPRLTAVCEKMMAKSADQRFENMSTVAAALNQYLTASKTEPAAAASVWTNPADSVRPAVSDKPTVDHRPAPNKPSRSPSALVWTLIAAASAGMLLLAALAAVVILLRTPDGVVRIEITDPQTEVEFAGDTIKINDAGQPIEVTPGKYKLKVRRGALAFETDEFTVGSNGDVKVRVSWTDGRLQARSGDQVLGSASSPTAQQPPLQSDPSQEPVGFTLEQTFDAAEGHMFAVAFAPDGRSIVSSSVDQRLRTHDIATGQTNVRFPNAFTDMAVTSDSQAVLVQSTEPDVSLELRRLSNGELLQTFAGEKTRWCVALSPQEHFLAAGTGKAVIVWEKATGKLIHRLDGFKSEVRGLVFTSDDAQLAAGADQGEIQILDLETKQTRSFMGPHSIDSLAATPDDKSLLLGGWRGEMSRISLASGASIWSYTGVQKRSGRIASIDITNDGRYAVIGGFDGVLRLWRVADGRELATATTDKHDINVVALSPDDRQVATGGGKLFDPQKGFVNDGDYRVRLWRLPAFVWPRESSTGKAPAPADWTPLFNGEDMDDWDVIGTPGCWTVEDGVLIGAGDRSFLATKRDDFTDFHLRAVVNIDPASNSGLYVRTTFDKATRPLGYEEQVTTDQTQGVQTGGLYIMGETGVIAGVKPDPSPPFAASQWHDLDVLVRGNRLILRVNGEVTIDYTDPKSLYNRGRIALQLWGRENRVQFKSIEIKELTAP